ncbi:MAG: TIGR04282 family arsenosugar biosynthesis glycosyltransferase [Acidobacteriota bacterium]|nr:TIGR04282 family arsenosugar biosynthesis glycosyltransferase [Acidobacteriota bacterium]
MAKVPTAGNVKTRLEPYLTPEQCAELAECFLLDTVGKAEFLPNQIIIAYTPFEKRDVLLKILPTHKTLIEQKGTNLGERMFHAFQFACSQNLDAVVMIGTDSPTFPTEFIEQAFENLKKSDTCLGKTKDGGFYLLGLRTLRKEIFENVAWSSAETFAQTSRNIEKIGLKLSLLPTWFDVDFPADLERLRKDLAENPIIAPRTFEWLKKNYKRQS